MPKLSIHNMEIYYEITGKGQPLLFIHGLASDSASWEKQVSTFSEHYRVVTFDLRGHGRSSKSPGSYSIKTLVVDTLQLMKTLQLGPVYIVGHSLGGMIGIQLSTIMPEMVKGLVIVNGYFEGCVRTFADGVECLKHIAINRLRRTQNKGLNLSIHPCPNGKQQLVHPIIKRLASHSGLAYVRTFLALLGWSAKHNLEKIRCPVLVIASEQDFVPVTVKEAYLAKIPRAELVVVPNSGHAVHREQPEKFNHILMEFLMKHS